MKKLLIILLLLSVLPETQAQDSEIPNTISHFDVAGGVGSGVYTTAISWNRTHGLLKSKKLRLGYGLRYGIIGGGNLDYTTAPAKLIKDEKIDTLQIKNAMNMNLAANIHIEYIIIPKLKVGFNIDAVGLAFGPKRTDTRFISSEIVGPTLTPDASPTALSLLLVGNNDIGTLKSEFFAAYAVSSKSWLRAGLDMTFSEYTTNVKLTENNDRFRYKAILLFIGLSYNPF